jgi:hypothetical protein
MRNLTFLAILFTAACSTFSKKPPEMGSLKGNVFWKYNNYVGNKPDAGASIKLYSLLDTSYLETATCDVQGNYSIDSVPTGYYLLIVASSATTESPSSALENLYFQGAVMKTIARDSLQGLKKSWDSINALDNVSEKLVNIKSSYERLLKLQEIRDSTNHISDRWFNARTTTALGRISKVISSSPKVRYEMITIKPKRVETVITDFGITYF